MAKFKVDRQIYVVSLGGRALVFKNGVYKTEDKDEIAAIKADGKAVEVKESKK